MGRQLAGGGGATSHPVPAAVTVLLLLVIAILGSHPCRGQGDTEASLVRCNDTCAPRPSKLVVDYENGSGNWSGSTTTPYSYPDNPFQRSNVCRCDAACVKFGDCCRDAPALLEATSDGRDPVVEWECVRVRSDMQATWVRRACKPGWDGPDEVRVKCERGADARITDPNGMAPVTSPRTNVTYANVYCAACNDDLNDTRRWQVNLDCKEFYGLINMTGEDIRNNIELDPTNSSWGVWFTAPGDFRRFFACVLEYAPQNLSSVYTCNSFVSTCDPSWAGTETEKECKSYQSVINVYGVNYRNPECMVCNNDTAPHQICGFYSDTSFVSPRGFSFSILMDVSPSAGNIVGKKSLCNKGELYDPFYKVCRNVLCGVTGYVLDGDKCIKDENEIEPRSGNGTIFYTQEFLACRKTMLNKGEYMIRPNGYLYATRYDRDFAPDSYLLEGDLRALVCIIFNGTNEIAKFSRTMGYVSAVGLGVSISCLVAHLVVFFLVPDVRNLSGQNLACLSASLLVAYLSFLFGMIGEPPARACQASAVTTYYFFLASFFWMSTMAFDVWRTLRVATRELRVSSGTQWRRFFFYSLASWTLPAIIVGLAVFFDDRASGMPEDLRPLFGRHGCWFGQRKALLIFFAGPAGALMLLNITLFTSTAIMVISSTKSSVKRSGSAARRNFSLYVRLSTMMGLTWTLGLVAGYLDVEALWYLFVLFNAFEGLLIFLCFSCTRKVWTYLRDNVLMCIKREPYRTGTLSSGSGYNSNSTGTTSSGFSRRASPRSSTNYKRTAPYLGKKTSMDMY
ncbi:uncharacterized protein [Dermacentor andersoni]|uniref:uncharacterized protein n=1 Tax=Dermacentor andersoni TaxID=34620 RepID=UPI0021558FEA|nr:uncharacterized protein LOC126529181 [Dermacentor andersoni]XP_050032736.1 uncharacterized protein LOC126529181 [Dermacentor andersoni]XP_050032737.1 uncharacterized protein LOC126529181 [Dermacentor andersoni]XP_054925640.1 uncharacterized protein LOC126529181 [Dermacentor andersoni]